MKSHVLILATLASACGGDVRLNSGLEQTTKVEDLDASEVASFCASLRMAVAELDRVAQNGSCKISAVIETISPGNEEGGVDACEATFERCLAEDPEPSQGDCDLITSDCSATVAEVETCIDDKLSEQRRFWDYYEGRSCLQVLSGEPDDDFVRQSLPMSCKTLRAKCPNVLLGTDTLLFCAG